MKPSRSKQLTTFIETILCDVPISKDLIDHVDIAFTHISTGKTKNYERLEFLGDAVLRLAATQFIDISYPHLSVGECSTLRSHLVSDKWLSQVGQNIQLDQYLLLGRHAEKDVHAKATIYADSTEALIGAIFSSIGDIHVIHDWLTPHWIKTANLFFASPHFFNGKTILQEWTQAKGWGLPQYLTTECNQNHGDPTRFHCKVSICDQKIAEGVGKSRKEAEQTAASAAFVAIKKDLYNPIKSSDQNRSD